MLRAFSASILTMSLLYAVSFAVFASPEQPKTTNESDFSIYVSPVEHDKNTNNNVIRKVNFYDIPDMLGKRDELSFYFSKDNDVYLWKLPTSLNKLSAETISENLSNVSNHKKMFSDAREIKETITYPQSNNPEVVADLKRTEDLTEYQVSGVSLDAQEWMAIIVKPKDVKNPGYIYFYSKGYLAEIDIFFEGNPKYLKDTVTSSLYDNGYIKSYEAELDLKDVYLKESSIITFDHNQYSAQDKNIEYAYIKFTNKDYVSKISKNNVNNNATALKKDLGIIP